MNAFCLLRQYIAWHCYFSGSKSPQSVLFACDALHAGLGATVGCMTPLFQPGGACGCAGLGCAIPIGEDMDGCSGEPNPGGLFGCIGAREML